MLLVKSICPTWAHPWLKMTDSLIKCNTVPHTVYISWCGTYLAATQETAGSRLNRLYNICVVYEIYTRELRSSYIFHNQQKHWITYTYLYIIQFRIVSRMTNNNLDKTVFKPGRDQFAKSPNIIWGFCKLIPVCNTTLFKYKKKSMRQKSMVKYLVKWSWFDFLSHISYWIIDAYRSCYGLSKTSWLHTWDKPYEMSAD